MNLNTILVRKYLKGFVGICFLSLILLPISTHALVSPRQPVVTPSPSQSAQQPVPPQNSGPAASPILDLSSQPEAQPGFLTSGICNGALKPADIGDPDNPNSPQLTGSYNECDLADFIILIKRLIDFAIFVAMFISTAVFIYAGFLYFFSSGNTDHTKKAIKMIKNTLFGLLIIVLAWVGIHTLVQILGVKDSFNGLQDVDAIIDTVGS